MQMECPLPSMHPRKNCPKREHSVHHYPSLRTPQCAAWGPPSPLIAHAAAITHSSQYSRPVFHVVSEKPVHVLHKGPCRRCDLTLEGPILEKDAQSGSGRDSRATKDNMGFPIQGSIGMGSLGGSSSGQSGMSWGSGLDHTVHLREEDHDPMPDKKQHRPAQHQNRQPGLEKDMTPKPESTNSAQTGSGRLRDKVAIITGGDSGIGRAVAVAFAKEGADVGIVYLDEHEDAEETKRLVEKEGRRCLAIAGDV